MKTVILAITLMLGLTSFGQETTCGRNLKYNLVYVEYIGTDYTDGIYVDLFYATDSFNAGINLAVKYTYVATTSEGTIYISKGEGCILVVKDDLVAVTKND